MSLTLDIVNCDCHNWSKCEVQKPRNRPIITVKEKNRIYEAKNVNRRDFITVEIDKKLVNSQIQKKCDFLLLDTDKGEVYFIELKGVDVKTAIEQIDNTISLLGGCIKSSGYKKYRARIVCTKVPASFNTPEIKKFKDSMKKNGGDVVIKSLKLPEDIE